MNEARVMDATVARSEVTSGPLVPPRALIRLGPGPPVRLRRALPAPAKARDIRL